MILKSNEGQDFPHIQALTKRIIKLSTISFEASLSDPHATQLFSHWLDLPLLFCIIASLLGQLAKSVSACLVSFHLKIREVTMVDK